MRRAPGAVGAAYERAAERYLIRHGLSLVCRNFRCRLGEIDLVMQDGDAIVFVEVRYRGDDAFGSALETITTAKQRRVVRAAMLYLQQTARGESHACRIDAIGVRRAGKIIEFDWIKNAFST